MTLAASFTVSGLHGWLVLISFLLAAVAAGVAWVMGRQLWAALTAAALALFFLAQLITG